MLKSMIVALGERVRYREDMSNFERLVVAFSKVERPGDGASRSKKKNFAEALSRELAQCIADCLRESFSGIKPDADGSGHESKARTAKGFKQLDVNYSTPELGLGLGVSIKTLNFRDKASKRYTKNYTRIDNELRAEALDYHLRQPYAVMQGVIFLPLDSCDDARSGASSFGQAVRVFRSRCGRNKPGDSAELFERLFIGLYDVNGVARDQDCRFFDVENSPPRARRPRIDETLSFDQLLPEICRTYDQRNDPSFDWAD